MKQPSNQNSLTNTSIQHQLSTLSLWKSVTSTLPGKPHKVRTELVREFRFSSFEEAMSFMQAAVPHINQVNHHPRWENACKTVTAWLSTWDGGNTISRRDIELAIYLDGLFDQFRESHAELV